MPQHILHASTVCTHASTYRKDANTWSALRNRCRHMSTNIPGRPHHHRLPAPTATSRATGGLVLHSRGVPIARIYLSCAIAPTSDFASPPPPAPPQTPSAPATAPPTPPPHHSSLARAVVARRSCACARRTSFHRQRPSSMSPPPHTHAARRSMWPLARAQSTRPSSARSPPFAAAHAWHLSAPPGRSRPASRACHVAALQLCSGSALARRRACLERRPVVDDA